MLTVVDTRPQALVFEGYLPQRVFISPIGDQLAAVSKFKAAGMELGAGPKLNRQLFG